MHNGLHETYVQSRELIPPEILHVCNVFEGRGKSVFCVFA